MIPEPQNIRLIGGPKDGQTMTIPGHTHIYGILVFNSIDADEVRRAYLETGIEKPVVTQTVRYYRHAVFGDVWIHQDLMAALEDSIDAAHTHTTH